MSALKTAPGPPMKVALLTMVPIMEKPITQPGTFRPARK